MSGILQMVAASGGWTTWSTTDKSASITLSGSNLIATRNADAVAYRSVRATRGYGSGKWYFEVTCTQGGIPANDVVLGIGTASATLTNYVGSDTAGYGYIESGLLLNNSLSLGSFGTYTTGQVVRFAVDLTNNRLWVSRVGQDWNGSATADPATNTEGFSITAGTYFPMFSGNTDTQASTANFGASAFSGTPPSGFVAWRN